IYRSRRAPGPENRYLPGLPAGRGSRRHHHQGAGIWRGAAARNGEGSDHQGARAGRAYRALYGEPDVEDGVAGDCEVDWGGISAMNATFRSEPEKTFTPIYPPHHLYASKTVSLHGISRTIIFFSSLGAMEVTMYQLPSLSS